MAQGVTNGRVIADALVVSASTVHYHKTSIMLKLGLHNSVQVALWAAQHGTVVDDLWEPVE
jgi:DNA-binding NarL/FixJ family response regulator